MFTESCHVGCRARHRPELAPRLVDMVTRPGRGSGGNRFSALTHRRSVHRYAVGLSHIRQLYSPTQARVPTRTENQHSHTHGGGSVYGNTDTDFEKSERRCADVRKDVSLHNHVEVISWRTEAGFSGSNRGQERVSNWIDCNFEDASCSDFMVSESKRRFFCTLNR